MTQIHVAHDGRSHVCYTTTTGIDVRPVGCRHDTPGEAIEHSDRLEATERKGDTDALLRDHLRPALVGPEPAP